MHYERVIDFLRLDLSPYALMNSLRSRGYKRYVGARKPPISNLNRARRLRWALNHQD